MRKIRLSEEDKAAYLANIANSLDGMRVLDNINVIYKPKEEVVTNKISLDFDPMAYLQMRTLIEENSTECAWQGTVKMTPDRQKFTIKSILVYPQTVTGATVNTDDALYDAWHQARDDETYNTLRLQGHSHVNMGVTPSGVDKTLYNDMLQTIRDDSYYIFMIVNKKNDVWINIYDLPANAIYDKSDIAITVGGINLDNWSKEQKKMFRAIPTHALGGTPQSSFQMPDHTPVNRSYKDYLEPDTKRNVPSDPDIYETFAKNLRNPYYASDKPQDVNSAILEQEAKTGKPVEDYGRGLRNKPGRPAGSRNK